MMKENSHEFYKKEKQKNCIIGFSGVVLILVPFVKDTILFKTIDLNTVIVITGIILISKSLFNVIETNKNRDKDRSESYDLNPIYNMKEESEIVDTKNSETESIPMTINELEPIYSGININNNDTD